MENVIRSLPTVEVNLRKQKPFNFIRKVFFATMGLIGICLSITILLTVIGIIPGIFMGIISSAMFIGALDYFKVECPNCKKETYLIKNKVDFECKRCHEDVIVEWVKK